MQFERDTLTQVVEARNRAVSAPDQASRMAAENQITAGMGRLLAVMENYPQLKADENVVKLQEELTTTENQIAFTRQAYNDVVLELNTKVETLPDQHHRQQFRLQGRRLLQGRARRRGAAQGRSFTGRSRSQGLSAAPDFPLTASNPRSSYDGAKHRLSGARAGEPRRHGPAGRGVHRSVHRARLWLRLCARQRAAPR